jgi:hypothetical protein
MKIPKIIHYCWFGSKPIPELELNCIESWSKFLPDYEIMLWNEESFDINSITYVKQAYENKKFAFVSDYVRIHALYNIGGIYFDTDVEVIKPLDTYLTDAAFIGFENKTMIGTGIIGSCKKNKIFEKLLDYYKVTPFVNSKGQLDTATNVQILVGILEKFDFKKENSEQLLAGLHIYERDIFNPKKVKEDSFLTTERTVTIHHFSGSWLTEREKKRGVNIIWRSFFRPVLKKCRRILNKIFGINFTKKIEIIIRNWLR